jgi:hypothetical protein
MKASKLGTLKVDLSASCTDALVSKSFVTVYKTKHIGTTLKNRNYINDILKDKLNFGNIPTLPLA